MPGKISVYNLGQMGVNVVKNPIQLADGEIVAGQNVRTDTVAARGGLRKRDGMTVLNGAGGMSGSGAGIVNLPLPDRAGYIRRYFIPYDYGGGTIGTFTFWESTDGTTWTAGTRGVVTQQLSPLVALGFGPGMSRWGVHHNKLFYPGNDGYLHALDGDTGNDYKLISIPPNPITPTTAPTYTSILPFNDSQIVIGVADGTLRGRVFLMDVQTGGITQLGSFSDLGNPGVPICPFVQNNRIYAPLVNGSGGSAGRIYYTRDGDSVWTSHETLATNLGYVYHSAIFKGELYVGVGADSGSHGQIWKRSKDNVWSSVYSSDGTGSNNYCAGLIVSLDGLTIYAYQNALSGTSPVMRIISSTDGASWTSLHTLGDASGTQAVGQPYLDTNGDIYYVVFSKTGLANGIVTRLRSGSFTDVLTTTAHLGGGVTSLKMAS